MIEESRFKQGMVCKITEVGKEDVYYELEKFLIGIIVKLQEDALETEDGYFMGEVELFEGFDTGEENMGLFEKGESMTFSRVKFEKI